MGILSQPESANTTRPAFEAETDNGDTTMSETTTTPMIETPTTSKPETTTTTSKPEIQAEIPVQEAATANAPAVVPQAATEVAAPRAAKFRLAFDEQKWAFDMDSVLSLSSTGSVPRIKGEQGAAYVAEESFGTKIRMTVESWNPRWLISAGLGSNDAGYKESMDHLRNSYDGNTIEGETLNVVEYVQHLKDTYGYDKAGVNPYIDIWGFVTWTEKKGDIPEEDRTLYMLQASKTSSGNFIAFCTAQGLMLSKGIIKGEITEVEIEAQAKAKGSLKYTNFNFTVPKKKK